MCFFVKNNYNNQVFLSLRQIVKSFAYIFIIRNMFLYLIENNLFTSLHLICEKRNNSFLKGSIIRDAFCIKAFKVRFFAFPQKFLTYVLLNLIIFPACLTFTFKNLFLYLALFIIALWSSLVMKGASFARRYFFLIGGCSLKMRKIDSLSRPKSVSFKVQKV